MIFSGEAGGIDKYLLLGIKSGLLITFVPKKGQGLV
jgi:hypothetical protein